MNPEHLENIPTEMKVLERWLCCEKGSKAPTNAKTGKAGSSTNSNTWSSFECAANRIQSGAFAYMGIALNGDGLVAVDLDHCVENGIPNPKAIALLDEMGATYIEFSKSGNGLHAYGYGEQLAKGVNGTIDGLKVELYCQAHWMIVTGNVLRSEKKLPTLNGFRALATRLQPRNALNLKDEEEQDEDAQVKQNEWIRRILTGEVLHDSLRNLAASYIVTGMKKGAAINQLRALMNNSTNPRDERWNARYNQIPALVDSAYMKFFKDDFVSHLEEAKSNINQKFKLLSSKDLAEIPPLKWVVRGVMPSSGLGAIYGPSGSGKSFLALDMCAAISEGTSWFGHRVEQTPVIYVALEGEGGMKLRVQAWEQHHDRQLTDEMRWILQSFNITEKQDLAELIAAIQSIHTKGAVVVIDTLNRASPTADENSSKDMGTIIEGAKTIQTMLGGLCILVHHTGKDLGKGMRGHSSLFAALDASIEVKRNDNHREWKVAKSKEGEDNICHSFSLETVEMGETEYQEPINSCVVISAEKSHADSKKPLIPSLKFALECFHTAAQNNQTGDLYNDSVSLSEWEAVFMQKAHQDNKPAKQKAFGRARGLLVERKYMTVDNDVYTLLGFTSEANDFKA
jgi:hypothetical protein